MDQASTEDPRLLAWPFWILELSPKASSSDVEQAYASLKAKLALGVTGVARYSTPLGERPRDEYALRDARSLLMTPESRLLAEFWYLDPDFNSGVLDETGESKKPDSQASKDPFFILKVTPVNKYQVAKDGNND